MKTYLIPYPFSYCLPALLRVKVVLLCALLLLSLNALPQGRESLGNGTQQEISAIENGLVPTVLLSNATEKNHSIEERMQFYHVPGVSIAVFRNGKMAWSKGYGYADKNQSRKVDSGTMFQVASISKPVTAIGVLKLVEKYGLDMDKDVNAYLRGWKVEENEFTKAEKVTIRRLLSHTAGISGEGFRGYRKGDTIPDTEGVLKGAGNTAKISVQAVPGSKFAYSGGGYIVLQKLIEDVANTNFAQYMQQHVLLPLGMSSSTFDQFPVKRVSLAHDNKGAVYEGGWLILPEMAAAGLWTTPGDLVKFCLAVQKSVATKNGYLPQSLAKQMLQPQPNWGLGVGLRGEQELAYFFHGGKNPGFSSVLVCFYRKNLGVVITTNGDQGGTLRDEIVRSFSNYYDLKMLPPRVIKSVDVPQEELEALAGKYKFEEMGEYFLLATVNEQGLLELYDPNDGKKNTFVAVDKDTFVDIYNGDEAVFTKDANNQPISIRYNGSYQFVKVKP